MIKLLKQKPFRRFFWLIIGITFTLVVNSSNLNALSLSNEILWDTYGVPHIFAKDVNRAFYQFGWAQMHSHGDLILRLYGQARGKAAEYWGENYLASDRWVVTMGIQQRSKSWYKAQNPEFRGYLDAFAEGINSYVAKNPDLIDEEVKVVLPVTGEDILAHLQRVINFTFIANPEEVAGISQSESVPGSNGWAIAPTKSASGNALLLANPHLPWSDLFLWYEAQITAPGINAYGAALVGIPVLNIAFNDYLGWTHTVNTFDGWDLYALKLEKGGYLFDGKVQEFSSETFNLKIKQEDGSFVQQELVVKSSVHGAIIEEKDSEALALRVVGLDQPGALSQWWDMAKAKKLSEFETAIKRLQVPLFTIIYADRDGHIMHLFNGQVPIRSEGDFQYWQGVIPGNTSTNLWTKFHPYEDLPRVIDPESGWLQNANDPPWTTTFPASIDPDNYPKYMAPRLMYFRAQNSAQMLMNDESITFEEMISYKHSTRMELAERLLDDLILVARQQGQGLGQEAAEVLEAWDKQAQADSRGGVLFAFWAEEMDFESMFAQPWLEDLPLTTPDGLADPAKAVATLEMVAAEMKKTYGRLDISWGEVFRLKYGNVDLPANGGDGYLGIFRVVNFAPSENGRFQSVNGDSFVAVVEFSQPIKAMALNSYGNATQPHSTHVGDQLKLFTQQQLRPVWRTKEEIKAHLEASEVFSRT